MYTDSLSDGVGRIMVIPISSFTATDWSANASLSGVRGASTHLVVATGLGVSPCQPRI